MQGFMYFKRQNMLLSFLQLRTLSLEVFSVAVCGTLVFIGTDQIRADAKPPHPAAASNPAPGANGATDPNLVKNQSGVIWSIGHPPERVRYPAQTEIPFTVTSGGNTITDLRLGQSTLQDVNTFLQIDTSHLELCDENGKLGRIDIAANTTRRLILKLLPGVPTAGVYTGDVSFRITEKPETQAFKLTVYSRSGCSILWGVLCIASGLGLYFFVNVFLRRRIAIDEAVLPAYYLRDTIVALNGKLTGAIIRTGVQQPALTQALSQIDALLDPDALRPYLPSPTFLPWSAASTWQDRLKAYLTPISDKTAGLVVLVNSGIQTAVSYWTTFPAPVTTALGQIDALAQSTTNASTSQAQLSPILQTLYAAVNPPHAAALAPILAGAPINTVGRLFSLPPDTHTLELRVARNTLWIWWLVALIALLSGFYSMVLQNFGFGAATDYIKCFFWGLGFSVAGTQLDQLTQNAVTGSFGITLPKA